MFFALRLMACIAGLNLAVALSFCGLALAQSSKTQEIDLKLFTKSEVDLSKGCSVALWQADRDPDRDNFAYIFFEKLNADHTRQPARIKIGKDLLTLTRVATGGKAGDYRLFEYQLYKMAADHSFVVLQLKLGPTEGEAVEIEGGWLNVYQPGKLPARVSVKGGAGCYTPAAPAIDERPSKRK